MELESILICDLAACPEKVEGRRGNQSTRRAYRQTGEWTSLVNSDGQPRMHHGLPCCQPELNSGGHQAAKGTG